MTTRKIPRTPRKAVDARSAVYGYPPRAGTRRPTLSGVRA